MESRPELSVALREDLGQAILNVSRQSDDEDRLEQDLADVGAVIAEKRPIVLMGPEMMQYVVPIAGAGAALLTALAAAINAWAGRYRYVSVQVSREDGRSLTITGTPLTDSQRQELLGFFSAPEGRDGLGEPPEEDDSGEG